MGTYRTILRFTDDGKTFDTESTCTLKTLYKSGSTIVRIARRRGYTVRFTVYDEKGNELLRFYCRKREPMHEKGFVCRLSQFCMYGGSNGLSF